MGVQLARLRHSLFKAPTRVGRRRRRRVGLVPLFCRRVCWVPCPLSPLDPRAHESKYEKVIQLCLPLNRLIHQADQQRAQVIVLNAGSTRS